MGDNFDISTSGFAIRPAEVADARACRMLLPHFSGAAADYLIAVDGARGLVIGAAASTHSRRSQPMAGPGVAIHVIPPCRRYGVGRALLGGLLHLASLRNSQAIYSARKTDLASDEFEAWKRLGFHVIETVEEHELPMAEILPRLTPLADRLRERKKIPADAKIVPLYAANRAKVLQLHLDLLGGDRGAIYQRLQGRGPGAFHPRYSRVLMVGERIVGCILAYRRNQHDAVCDAMIVVPELRNGWANVWLKLDAFQGAAALGVTHFYFTTFDQYADTRSFTSSLGGITTRKWGLMIRPVEAIEPPPG